MRPSKCVTVAAAGIALGAATAVCIGTSLWKRTTARIVATLTTRHSDDVRPAAFSLGQVAELPEPVARYFRFALTAGQPLIRRARLEQIGTMRSDADKSWAPFSAVEHFSVRPPGFVWDASMPVAPLVSLHVRDSYFRGEGASEAKIAGLISLGALRGTPEAASASLIRYLAEATWLPTTLLPSENLAWAPIDHSTARATLTDGSTAVSIDVHFGVRGEIASISTMRHRYVNGVLVLTPWGGRYRDYTSIQGMMIPMAAEVEWILPDGPAAVWRGRITVADYEFTEA